MRLRGINSEEGMALVLTLTILVIITAMVVEFAYGVYVQSEFLHNWRSSQELSQSARSGAAVAAYLINEETSKKSYTYPGSVYLPPVDPFMDGSSSVSIVIEDEDSKFNLNSLIYQNGELDEDAHAAFLRMLGELFEDEEDIDTSAIADGIADWIDPDSVPRTSKVDSEDGARNSSMQSVEELLLVPGMGAGVYDKLVNNVTVYGSGLVNINGAGVPVLVSLSEDMNEELANRVIEYRNGNPFDTAAEIMKVAGFGSALGTDLQGRISVKGTAFRVTSDARDPDGVSAVVECIVDSSGKVSYWKEY